MDRKTDTRTAEMLAKAALQRAAGRARKQAEPDSRVAGVLEEAGADRNIGRAPYTDLVVATLLDWQGRQIELLEKRIAELEGR